jgi:hypothetical protein
VKTKRIPELWGHKYNITLELATRSPTIETMRGTLLANAMQTFGKLCSNFWETPAKLLINFWMSPGNIQANFWQTSDKLLIPSGNFWQTSDKLLANF